MGLFWISFSCFLLQDWIVFSKTSPSLNSLLIPSPFSGPFTFHRIVVSYNIYKNNSQFTFANNLLFQPTVQHYLHINVHIYIIKQSVIITTVAYYQSIQYKFIHTFFMAGLLDATVSYCSFMPDSQSMLDLYGWACKCGLHHRDLIYMEM